MQPWFSLPHLAGLVISGPDALDFCHSQFTADMRSLPEARWQITTWCNPKGRVIAVILTARHESHVEVIAPRAQLGALEKLSMYAIGRTVSIRSDDPVSGTLTAETNDNSIVNDKTRAMRLGKPAQDPTPEQVRAWRLADLATPLPWLTAETSASFLPQSLAMETNGGLSYTKGCFPGQEIIARVHYLGQAKYHLMGFEFELPRPLEQDPETIQLQSSAVPNESPTIITISCVPSGNYLVGLAVAPIQIQASHPVTASGPDWTLSGQMTALERLCYHRIKI